MSYSQPGEGETTFVRIGNWVRLLLHGLWVARVATVSVVLALLLFGMVPQAQDLFIELKSHPWGLWHWAVFYVLAVLLWIVPVHLSARLALQTNWIRMRVQNEAHYWAVTTYIPRALSFFCFVAISVGMYQAFANLPGSEKWTGILTVHKSFGSFFGAGADGHKTILEHAQSHLSRVFVFSLVLCIFSAVGLRWLGRASIATGSDKFAPRLHRRIAPVIDWACVYDRKADFTLEEKEACAQRNVLVALSFVLLVFWLLATLFVVFSVETSRFYLPRAILVPVLFGTLVPGLTFLSVVSHRTRQPCVLYLIVVWVTLSIFNPAWHDIRYVEKPPQPPVQMTIEKAIAAWKVANSCEKPGDVCPPPIIVAGQGGASRAAFFTATVLARLQQKSQENASGLPKSRVFSNQVFAISSVSGSALGTAVWSAAIEAQREATRQGGKPSAAFMTLPVGYRGSWLCNWFKCHASGAKSDRASSERQAKADASQADEREGMTLVDAVQRIIAGDFLTPTIHALAINDVWRLPWGNSRATTLEQVWEQESADVLKSAYALKTANVLKSGDVPKSEERPWLDQPLSRFAPDPNAAVWRPLLMFVGTSVETGRRIITSSLAPRTGKVMEYLDPKKPKPILFTDAYDFYEQMCSKSTSEEAKRAARQGSKCTCPEPDKASGRNWTLPTCDVRLSTAALNSARFPIVSPPGNILTPSGVVFQRIVDGGYFENFGLLTVIDIAREIMEATYDKEKPGNQLKPLILQITNDPEAFPGECNMQSIGEDDRDPTIVSQPFNAVLDPVNTVLNARIAHGTYATLHARRWLQEKDIASHYAKVMVCPEAAGTRNEASYKDLSMSWWLSMPVQEYLDKQVDNDHNNKAMTCILEALRPGKFGGCGDRGQEKDKLILLNLPPVGARSK